MDIQYKLITGTESSPIKVVVDAYATSATISWVYEAVIEQDFCYECSARKSQSQVIDLEPLECDEEDKETSGTISWKRFTIYYTVTQKGVECPCNKEESTTSKNVFIRSWVSPYEIYCNRETKQTALFYEYYKIIETCGVIQKNKIRKSIPIDAVCSCESDTHVVTGTKEAEEEFVDEEGHKFNEIPYSYKCVVNCDCNNFDFEKPNECNCNNFDFEKPNECNCNNFDFEKPNECNCNNFDFLKN